MHFHLTSTSLEHQRQTVDRSLALGARHLDGGPMLTREVRRWRRGGTDRVVMADPDGNESWVVTA
jgi:Glyoxalase-like domain